MLLAVGCLAVLRPFLSALLWAMILSFSSWPLHAWLVRRLRGRRTLAALLVTCSWPRSSFCRCRRWHGPCGQRGEGWRHDRGAAQGGSAGASRLGRGAAHHRPDPAERWLGRAARRRLDRGTEPFSTPAELAAQPGGATGEAILQVSLGVLAAFFFFRDGAEGAGALRRGRATCRRSGAALLAVAGSTVRSVVYGVIGTALAQATLQGSASGSRACPRPSSRLPYLLGFRAGRTAVGLAPGGRLAPVQGASAGDCSWSAGGCSW